MKKLLSLTLLLVSSLLLINCSDSSNEGGETASAFGKWEATDISYMKDNRKVTHPYLDLEEYYKPEILEIYLDTQNSAELIQYQSKTMEEKTYNGIYSLDVISFPAFKYERYILQISNNYLEIATKIIINNKETEVVIMYKKIGPPRDPQATI